MVKVFALLPRRTDVTEDYFHKHWAGPHAELALRITTIKRYVQSHRVAQTVSNLGTAPYEGIAEVWFNDVATGAAMGDDPNYANYAHLDEPNFIDTENLAFLMTAEHVVRSGGTSPNAESPVKALLLLGRAPGLTPVGFAEQVYGLDYSVRAARRITTAVVLPESYADDAEPAYDAVVELSFDTVADLAASQSDIQGLVEQLNGSIDKGRSNGFVAEELRLIWPEEVPVSA
jgi:uncharacterized protein (TIGR02118 family)